MTLDAGGGRALSKSGRDTHLESEKEGEHCLLAARKHTLRHTARIKGHRQVQWEA